MAGEFYSSHSCFCYNHFMISYENFEKVDIRVGKIIKVEDYPDARKPSYKLQIDFGPEIGIKKSIGQFLANYTKEELQGKLVACVVNFPPRQIGIAVSEVLTLGFADKNGNAVLITPTKEVPLGGRLF
jgi:tRNA-binding protein